VIVAQGVPQPAGAGIFVGRRDVVPRYHSMTRSVIAIHDVHGDRHVLTGPVPDQEYAFGDARKIRDLAALVRLFS
jgi:hypothetical protein